MSQERGGYLRQHLAVASLTEKKKRGYISIYGREGTGPVLSLLPAFTTQPRADSHTPGFIK